MLYLNVKKNYKIDFKMRKGGLRAWELACN